MTKDEAWLLEEKYAGQETPEFLADKARLAAGEPLAYIIGTDPFLGLTIHLDSHPLIPRVETEWWTNELLTHLAVRPPSERNTRAKPLSFLDLCAGSGAIGCAALARLPQAQVYFGEIDPAHEATITRNIRENKLDETRADIRIGDLFEPFGDLTFDVIAANPPYIRNDRPLPKSVAQYEPPIALYGGSDGLDVIRRIATGLPKHLKKDGIAWIECDSEHAEAARSLFVAQGLSAEICNDQYDRPRVLVVSFPQ